MEPRDSSYSVLVSPCSTKKVIDIVMGLLFIVLLGYSFTGAPFHEVAGILHSRYLFHTGIHMAGIGQIHTVLALAGFVLIAFHVLVHAFGHAKKEYRILPIVLMVWISVLAVLLDVWLLPYLRRHFLTVEIDQETVISGESVDFNDRKILTVYFTRVGNTDFADDVDAVSRASLLLNEKKEFLGNSQVIGQMIQDAIGGDIISINTKEWYPPSYSDTVSAASKEMRREELPELVDMPENMDGYDTVFLVFPKMEYGISLCI